MNKNKSSWYSEYFEKEVGLSEKDQKWIWDNVPHIDTEDNTDENEYGYENDYATCEIEINTELILSKRSLILELEKCNHKTSPKHIASLLIRFFGNCGFEVNWLYYAQHWNARSINGSINRMIKQFKRGEASIRNPAKYFIFLLKKRKKRKKFRGSNATDKNNHED